MSVELENLDREEKDIKRQLARVRDEYSTAADRIGDSEDADAILGELESEIQTLQKQLARMEARKEGARKRAAKAAADATLQARKDAWDEARTLHQKDKADAAKRIDKHLDGLIKALADTVDINDRIRRNLIAAGWFSEFDSSRGGDGLNAVRLTHIAHRIATVVTASGVRNHLHPAVQVDHLARVPLTATEITELQGQRLEAAAAHRLDFLHDEVTTDD